MKNKILFVINKLSGYGGAQRAGIKVCNYLVEAGYNIDILSLRKSDPIYDIHENISIYYINNRSHIGSRVLGKIIYKIKLYNYVNNKNYNIVISFTAGANIEVLSTLTKNKDNKVIVSERSSLPRVNKSEEWNNWLVNLYKKSNLVTSNSNTVLRYLNKKGVYNTFHTPNPFDLPYRYKKHTSFECKPKTMLCVGGLREAKGYDILFKALSKLQKQQLNDVTLIIIGDGPLKNELHLLSDRLGISNLIKWEGASTTIEDYYLRADFLILPSRWEGVPNVLLEALGYGLPAIISDYRGNLEYVNDGEEVLVFKNGDSSDLSKKIMEVLSSTNLRKRLSINARRRAEIIADEHKIDVWQEAIHKITKAL